jgi:hypothetical protein
MKVTESKFLVFLQAGVSPRSFDDSCQYLLSKDAYDYTTADEVSNQVAEVERRYKITSNFLDKSLKALGLVKQQV